MLREHEQLAGLLAKDRLQTLVSALHELRLAMARVEAQYRDRLSGIRSEHVASARNLLHYVALRQHDVRDLQQELHCRGLSSLGRCEANVLATVNAVIQILCRLSGFDEPPSPIASELDFQLSRKLLVGATRNLFGPPPSHGTAQIMVTMPSESAQSLDLISDLVREGMDCMRINCAHDDAAAWTKMAAHLRHACAQQHRDCRLVMDLAGPKLRTGPVGGARNVLRWRPVRDTIGRVIESARIWIPFDDKSLSPPVPCDAILPVAELAELPLSVGDLICFTDARGRNRIATIDQVRREGIWAESQHSAYLVEGLPLFVVPSDKNGAKARKRFGRVGALNAADPYLMLYRGEQLILGDERVIGRPAQFDERGQRIRAATIGCTLPSVFRDVRRGERVLFDDGKIAARVNEIHEKHLLLQITEAAANGAKLRADKGINFPDTDVQLDALTDKDLQDIGFIVEHADIVGYSFVRRPADVERLQEVLAKLGHPDKPILLKIENRQAFEHLPSLLLTAMRSPVCGVMIARGDLAVELGWQRLAEVQEEILWMCEAAHAPVVWATQVLENLAKTGTPSRAEITDAAMAVRAECVMLNKGEHIVETVRVLSDILRRMQDHQVKKRPLLRHLRLADDLVVTDIHE